MTNNNNGHNSDHSDSSASSEGVVLPAVTVPKNYDGNLSSISVPSSSSKERILPEIVKICIDSPSEEEHSYTAKSATTPTGSDGGSTVESPDGAAGAQVVVGIKYNGTIV